MSSFLLDRLIPAVLLALVMATAGCRTIQGSLGGGLHSLAAAGNAQHAASSGYGPSETAFAFGFGAVVGGVIGLGEDLQEAVNRFRGQHAHGVAWDSPEGIQLRTLTGPPSEN